MSHVRCPHCSARLDLLPRQLGRPVVCPDCGKTFAPARRRHAEEEGRPENATAAQRRPELRQPGRRAGGNTAAVLRTVVWGLCLLWSVGVALLYLVMLFGAAGAVQEASASAMACFAVILGYVCARCVDSATRP